MDGTLVDTNRANFLAYNKAFKSVTQSKTDLEYNPDKRLNRSALKTYVPYLTEHDYERIILEKEIYYDDFLNEMTLITENINILNKYSNTNRTFLVTNCRKDRALKTLIFFGIKDKFKRIFFREFGDKDEKVNKFKNAISILGVTPNTIILFENEENEIKDALDAGIQFINPKLSS